MTGAVMRRATVVLAMAIFLAGCEDDPEWPSLPTGADAMTYDDRSPSDLVPVSRGLVALDVGKGQSDLGLDREILDSGIRVRVIRDAGAVGDKDRPVKVRVLETKYADRVGTIARQSLRPIPR
jgi:hypothetical protein